MMNRLAMFASLLLAVPAIAQDQEEWIQDFAAAKAKAKAEKKDLLIDFTGSDWCGWCIKLDKEVFSTPEFQAAAPKMFVFVKLDFPRNKELVTDDIRAQNQQLQMEFGVKGYPSIFLADAEGKPYGKTGYQAGGPEKYLAHLGEFQAKKTAYDAALTKAKTAKGADRAKALNTALTALDADLVLQHYSEQVQEVIALDADGKLGIKKAWEGKLAEQLAAQELENLQKEMNQLGKDWDKAMARCDEVITADKSKALVQFATIYKAIATMEGQQDLEAALALLEKAKTVDPSSVMAKNCDRIAGQMKTKAGKAGGDKGK